MTDEGSLQDRAPPLTPPDTFESSRRRIDPSSGPSATFLRPSFLVPLVGETGLAQIELPLDPAPRLVFQVAVAVEIVDQLALGFDQSSLDLVVDVGELAAGIVAVVLEFVIQQSGALAGAE